MTVEEFKPNLRKPVKVDLPQHGLDGVYELRGYNIMDIGAKKPQLIKSVILMDKMGRYITVPIEAVEVIKQ